MEIGHVVLPTGFQVHEQGDLATDLVEGLERDLALEVWVAVYDGEEVDDGVGGAADGLEDDNGVEEGFAG